MKTELKYIEGLINDLEGSKEKCSTGFTDDMPICQEINILKSIYYMILSPNIIERKETIEKVINQSGEKVSTKEIIKTIKKDGDIKLYINKIKKSTKKILDLEKKILSENDFLKKIEETNQLLMSEINKINVEIEESKKSIKEIMRKCFDRGA